MGIRPVPDMLPGLPAPDAARLTAFHSAGALSAEFPAYMVTVHARWHGLAFHAVRRAGSGAGVYAVVTSDEDELRTALAGAAPCAVRK